MDTYYPKTRRPRALFSKPLKKPPKATSPIRRPTTPENQRITRPAEPPPVKRKQRPVESSISPITKKKPTVSVRELFRSAHPPEQEKPEKPDRPSIKNISEKLEKPVNPESPSKITSGPLKGVSTSLLDLIRAKEAQVKESPEQLRQRELLGIAPDIARIVPNIFTANKRDVMPYDRVVEKCFKALRSNYNTSTIIECLDLMDKVAPEWVTNVEISRGRFMRLNKDKSTLPELLRAIERYKKEKIS